MTLTGIRTILTTAGLILISGSTILLSAQVCRLSVAGLNRARAVFGPVSAECPSFLHSAPFGNWGATSNFGQKHDGHQFDGWCHNQDFCDNTGSCGTCSDRWYEWNSCTDRSRFQPPNCSLYNSEDCTQQVSTTGVNVLGTQAVDLPVACPGDFNGDEILDQGGCSEVTSYSHGENFMSLYELDFTGDELIQTLYFPETLIQLSCDVWGCAPTGSNWVAPVSYQNPDWPPKVYAEMAVAMNFGVFVDPNQICPVTPSPLTSVSAASFRGPAVAPGSIVSAFGSGLAPTTESAAEMPLPTSLAGITLKVTDSAGVQHTAPLIFASPQQVNFLMPANAAAGEATVSIEGIGGGLRSTGESQVQRVTPALFSANGDGKGVAAALAVRVAPDGSQHLQFVFVCGPAPGTCVPIPVAQGGEDDEVFLVMFGTGIRGRSSLLEVEATVGGLAAEVTYAGPQPDFAGLDQVNLRLPRGLTAGAELEVVLTVEDLTANTLLLEIAP